VKKIEEPNAELPGKILVEEVLLLLHGNAAEYRPSPSGAGNSSVGGGVATLRVTGEGASVRVTISRLDVLGLDLEVPREIWDRRLDVGSLHGGMMSGPIMGASGLAKEWHLRPGGREVVDQNDGSLLIVDTGRVVRATLTLHRGLTIEMDITLEEWARAFAESSGRTIAETLTREDPSLPEEVTRALCDATQRLRELHTELLASHLTLRGTLALPGVLVGYGLGAFVANGMTDDQLIRHVLSIVSQIRQASDQLQKSMRA